MLVVETIGRIRREHFIHGKSIKEIARDLRLSRNTVRKVLRSDETSFSYERQVQPRPKLGFGAVGWQKQQPSASLADGLFGGRAFVGGQIVQDDDVALLQRGDELGAHVGLEDRPVDRRVDDPRRGQGAAAQSGDESLSLPMAKGSLRAKASFAPAAASARAGHLRVGSRFVDEDQPMGLGPHLGLSFSLPHRARLAHVGPIAFTGLKAFF